MIHNDKLMVMIDVDRLNELRDAEKALIDILEDAYKPECNVSACDKCGVCSSNKSMKYPERDAGPKAYEDDIVAQDALDRFKERFPIVTTIWYAGPESYTMI